MAGQCVTDHSSDCRPLNRSVRTSKQALATVTRLQQWKKRNDTKREVKAKLQDDERIEEEEYFLSLSKALPVDQVHAAAVRNYQAAAKLRWKRLMFQAIAEQQQLDQEMAECTFRPRSSCAAAAAKSTNLRKVPFARRGKPADGDVFERLYKPQANMPAATTVSPHGRTMKRLSSQAEAAFIARQERDQVDRRRRRSELAAQLHHLPHKPRLSRHSLEICAALRENDTDQPKDHQRREQKSWNPMKQVRYTIPAFPSADGRKHTLNCACVSFTTLIEALKQQEQRMRCISTVKDQFER